MAEFHDKSPSAAPSDPNGSTDGRVSPGEDPPQATESPSSSTSQAGPESPASAIAASLAGEPDTLPPTWCKKCKAEVIPYGKGKCPRCHVFLKFNFVARRHPVNKLRKQQILDKLVADYRPQTTLMHATCEHLADALEQLESVKAGSVEWQRLTEVSQKLGGKLDESRSTTFPQVSVLGTFSTDQLLEKTTAILHQLLERRDAETAATLHYRAPDAPSEPEETPARPAPAPEPVICNYCHRVCVGPDHPAFDVLHWNAPEQTAKRIERRNRIEARMAGRPLPEWYR